MKIEINSDIDKYKETIALGLNAKQMVFSILALGVGTGIVLGLYNIVGMTAAVYIAIPFVAPIGLAGFYNFRGMSFFEVTKNRLNYSFHNRPLLYHSVNEGKQVILEHEKKLQLLEKQRLKEAKKSKRKKTKELTAEEQMKAAKKKLVRVIVGFVILILFIAGGIVAYQMGWLEEVISLAENVINEYF